MAVSKFRFVSPGVFVNEIDNSQIPASPAGIGPVVIGRSAYGPGMRPITVNSFEEFVENFGTPIPGNGGTDVWRDGNRAGPTYAAYAAQAYLRNSSPLTFVRLMGVQNANNVDTPAAQAGWKAGNGVATTGRPGGAYGLFIMNSGSTGAGISVATGVGGRGGLAAVWYFATGSIALSGNIATHGSTDLPGEGVATLIKSQGAGKEFKAVIRNADGTQKLATNFNFNRNSDRYIRKVFNTNPQSTNSNISNATEPDSLYWLGETYDRHVEETVPSGTNWYGVILGIGDGTSDGANYKMELQEAESPYLIAQDLTTDTSNYDPNAMQQLFKFVGRDGTGEWTFKNLKISIVDIKASTNEFDAYGTFGVQIRKIDDSDNRVKVLEQFNNLTLNPEDVNYIARRIGNKYTQWDNTQRRYIEYNEFDNVSKYVRVEMNDLVHTGEADHRYLPFGFKGYLKYKDFNFASNQPGPLAFDYEGDATSGDGNLFVIGSGSIGINQANLDGLLLGAVPAKVEADIGTVHLSGSNPAGYGDFIMSHFEEFTGSLQFPSIPLRMSASDGGISAPRNAYFGFHTGRNADSLIFEESIIDVLRPRSADLSQFAESNAAVFSEAFSLDNVKATGSGDAVYLSGSRVAGTSMTAASSSYTEVLNNDFNRFTLALYGGFDGMDITEKEPFRNSLMNSGDGGVASANETTSYVFETYKRAIDVVSDPEIVEMNLLTIPGLTNVGLTNHALTMCEDRADAMAVIDLENGYIPSTENTNNVQSRRGSVTETLNGLLTRGLNSSYGAAYYPWVQIRDSLNGSYVWVPPSVVALGVYSSSQRRTELWFAPAGFNRGGLTQGSAGLPVIAVNEQLTSRQRDDLYAANVNPIAKFPNEGIVVFGQKTLQVVPSALDRVNVRRLLIFLKKRISQIAATLLFDPNIETTWERFRAQVVPFLESVQARFGLTDFRLVLDETTTTPDLVDRNVMYAKIFLKPTRAIEFIALDFNITRAGAAFDD